MNESRCFKNAALKVVLEAINAVPIGTAFLEDKEGKLVGIFTDGDFRRLLLNGRELHGNLKDTDFGDFVYAHEGDNVKDLLSKTNEKVRLIPIVDKDFKLIDYFRYQHETHFLPVAEPSLLGKELEYVTDAVLSTWISSRGKYIDRFESEFSSFVQCKYGVCTSNGTTALHLALVALNIGPGDEVIVPDLTFAATINAVLYVGATPVIVDVEKDRWTISPTEIRKTITDKTKAIIPVHVYGQPCDMDSIMEIAHEFDLKVIEDCAEAHGASIHGKKVGSFGDIGIFSFFGNKIITTGEGGMCVSNSAEIDERMRMLRDHGMDKNKRYWHQEVGFNYRMTNIQAAIGCAQLERIDEIIAKHKSIESNYRKALKSIPNLEWQKDFDGVERVIWLVCVLDNDRENTLKKLANAHIDVRPFFYCLSDMPIYKDYLFSNKEAKNLSSRGINLPTVDNIDFDRIKTVFQS